MEAAWNLSAAQVTRPEREQWIHRWSLTGMVEDDRRVGDSNDLEDEST
jgi:hypothetical protein